MIFIFICLFHDELILTALEPALEPTIGATKKFPFFSWLRKNPSQACYQYQFWLYCFFLFIYGSTFIGRRLDTVLIYALSSNGLNLYFHSLLKCNSIFVNIVWYCRLADHIFIDSSTSVAFESLLNFRHPPYHPPPGMSVLHSVQPAFIPYQDS